MEHRYFFGYGSLVNRATHDYAGAFTARLTGWRRAWRRSPSRALCYLSVEPAAGVEILGLVAPVAQTALQALDVREQAYQRADVSHALSHAQPDTPMVEIHTLPEGQHHDPTDENPILLSYLDVVVQGYLREFGNEGVAHFFATTAGWQAPILDDRSSPVYPRAQRLTAAQTALVDTHLKQLQSPIIPLSPSSWHKYLWGVRGAKPPGGSSRRKPGRNP